MFSSFASLVPPTIGPPPKDVPPPTPVNLPQCNPQLLGSSSTTVPSNLDKRKHSSVVSLLQTLRRPADLSVSHFAALGVQVHIDAPAELVIPEPSCVPSASQWDGIDLDEASRRDGKFRTPLSNGRLSPEARIYLERRNELSTANQAAFQVVRRMKVELGKPPIRLGNCYGFFKDMEHMASYWDDTSLPPLSEDDDHDQQDAPVEKVGPAETTAVSESNTRAEKEQGPQTTATPERTTYRTSPGSQMPPDFRHGLVSAFIKLVAYDFGCNIAPPRVEPRLYLVAPPPVQTQSKSSPAAQMCTYFSSGCIFLYRTPTTRDAARAGIAEGPIAAISARNTTSFSTPTESNVDFARELIAALATAQLRAREGKTEKRYGEGQWWATAKRWGGGEGGPIGREVEGDAIVGDKDAKVNDAGETGSRPGDARSSSAKGTMAKGPGYPQVMPFRGPPANKKQRKTHSMYDRYRMVRLPTSNWDKKAKYEAIGKVRGAAYDDVFVISSLFHHLSVLRVRVPDRLLEVLDGAPEDDEEEGLSWGRLEVWRSKWFDLFVPEDRLEAMRLIWGMMTWTMRKTETDGDGNEDKVMKDT